MGHVDTGKTKLLDRIRRSNIQAGEAGGITQQIGATYFPGETLKEKTHFFESVFSLDYSFPGLLILDTPGHESFSNLRSRGSSLCDIAVLVIDIMHGVEQQTRESIDLLQKGKVPYIIALNKIDRLSGWEKKENQPFVQSMRSQSQHTKDQYTRNLERVMTQMQEIGINTQPYNRMKFQKNQLNDEIPIVPTSAITGEGIPDLLALLLFLTQTHMSTKLITKTRLECSVLEVKVEEGIGTTLDVILVNGVLHVNDTIVVASMNGPIVTKIRALMTPEPMKELRVKSLWVHYEKVYAAMGCKIAAPDLTGAIAGSELFVARTPEEVPDLVAQCEADINSVFTSVDKTEDGLLVHASTLGSLEALLHELKKKKYAVNSASIGPVFRKDLLQIQHMAARNPAFAVVLAFDVPIIAEAAQFAIENKITIYTADIIYHLIDSYTEYLASLKRKAKEAARASVIFPCELVYLENQMIHRTRPVIIGVKVVQGVLKKGTPLSTAKAPLLFIGTVETIQIDKKAIDEAKQGQEVAICLKDPASYYPTADTDFKPKDHLISKLNRNSIDLLKDHFREDLTPEDWKLIISIKKTLNIT